METASLIWPRPFRLRLACPLGPEVLQELPLQHPSGLDEQAAIDRFVRHLIIRLFRMGALEPASDLLGRPLPPQLGRYCPGQDRSATQLARLGTQGPIPGGLIGTRGAIA